MASASEVLLVFLDDGAREGMCLESSSPRMVGLLALLIDRLLPNDFIEFDRDILLLISGLVSLAGFVAPMRELRDLFAERKAFPAAMEMRCLMLSQDFTSGMSLFEGQSSFPLLWRFVAMRSYHVRYTV